MTFKQRKKEISSIGIYIKEIQKKNSSFKAKFAYIFFFTFFCFFFLACLSKMGLGTNGLFFVLLSSIRIHLYFNKIQKYE